MQLLKNKFARFVINVAFVFFWFELSNSLWNYALTLNRTLYEILTKYYVIGIGSPSSVLLFLIPSFFISRFIWFEKSRNRIFFGFFNIFKKFEPRIYTTTSNAEELKKYADLKDQGIITEEEFQAKKKKLLDL